MAEVDARIRHLSESKEAARECASTAARAAAAKNATAEELLSRKIPKGQSLERYQHRTNLRLQRAVELAIVGITQADPGGGGSSSPPIGITVKIRPGCAFSSVLAKSALVPKLAGAVR